MNQLALDFSQHIRDLTQTFVGRKWLLQEVENLLQQNKDHYLVITGEPGIGKSAFAAYLTQTHTIHAYHFCITHQGSTLDPIAFVRSLSSQLSVSLSDFAAYIWPQERADIDASQEIHEIRGGTAYNVYVEQLILQSSSAREAFQYLIRDPLKRWALRHSSSECVILLVDALDEGARLDRHPNIVDLINEAHDLPDQVYWVLTTRPGLQLNALPGARVVMLDDPANNVADVSAYISSVLAEPHLTHILHEAGTDLDKLHAELIQRSRGNFLYLRYVFAALREDAATRCSFLTTSELPVGLNRAYRDFIDRVLGPRSRDEWRQLYRPVLGILAVAQEAIDFYHLVALSGVSPQDVNEVVNELTQFLKIVILDRETCYQIYHVSFTDVLIDRRRNPNYWIDPVHNHAQIANYYMNKYRGHWFECDSYGLRYLAFHLAEAAQWDNLYQLIGQPGQEQNEWAQVHLDRDRNFSGYLSDVNLAMRVTSSAGRSAVGWQTRCALILASVKSIATSIPPSLLAAAIRHGLLDPLKAISYAEQSADPILREWALAAVAPALDDHTYQQVLRRFERPFRFEHYRNPSILRALLQDLLERQWYDQAIYLVGQICYLSDWAQVLVELAHSMSGSLKERISARLYHLAENKTMPDDYAASALARWASVLSPDQRVPMLAKAQEYLLAEIGLRRHLKKGSGGTLEEDLMRVIEITTDDNASEHVLELLPFLSHLEPDSHRRVVEAALDAALRNTQEHHCRNQRMLLLGHVDDPERRIRLERETLQYWSNRKFGGWFLKLIWPYYLFALSPESRTNLLHEVILSQPSDLASARLLAGFVPYLDNTERGAVVEKVLRILDEIPGWGDDLDWLKTFDALCPFLTREQVLHVWHTTLEVGDITEQAIAQAAYSEESRTGLGQAVHSAFCPPFRSVNGQMDYWKSLRAFVRDQTRKHSLQATSWDWPSFYSEQGERLDEYLARLERLDLKKAREGLIAARYYWNGTFSWEESIYLLTIQAVKYKGKHRQALLNQAIKLAFTEGHEICRAGLLEDILLLCEPTVQVKWAEKVLLQVAKYKSEDVIAVTTAGLLPYSEPTKRVERIRASLQQTFAWQPGQFRKVDFSVDQVVLAMTRFWCEFSSKELYDTWLEILNEITQFSRPDLLITLAALAPLVVQVGSSHVRQQVIEAIVDITRWWP